MEKVEKFRVGEARFQWRPHKYLDGRCGKLDLAQRPSVGQNEIRKLDNGTAGQLNGRGCGCWIRGRGCILIRNNDYGYGYGQVHGSNATTRRAHSHPPSHTISNNTRLAHRDTHQSFFPSTPSTRSGRRSSSSSANHHHHLLLHHE